MRFNITVSGVSPLLMNRFTATNELQVGRGVSHALNRTAEKGTPRFEAEPKAYIDDKGFLYVPTNCMFQTIINGGAFFKAGKKQITTRTSSLIPAGMEIEELVLMVLDPTTDKPTKNWEVDTQSIVNPTTRGRSICHRPRVDKWSLNFTLAADSEMFNADVVRKVVDAAGKMVGLLDYTPRHRGPYGKFTVTKWVAVHDELTFKDAAE